MLIFGVFIYLMDEHIGIQKYVHILSWECLIDWYLWFGVWFPFGETPAVTNMSIYWYLSTLF